MDSSRAKMVTRDVIDTLFTYVNRDMLICKLFYFFFFAAFGSLYPLLAIYFKQLGMNATQSGILIGFRPFIEFCSAPFWGGVADKLKKWKQLILFALFCWIVFTLAMAGVTPPKVACIGEMNVTAKDVVREDLVKPAYSTVFYKKEDVHDAFFALLLIVVIGEFFSAPAITFADTVTLSYLGDDTDNYGRQRMFGSLGWGLAMFFVGMALDHSTTFPEHPCKDQHQAEKNYIVCFAVFTVLMSCAFITATQFRFPGQGGDSTLPTVVIAMKDKVKATITGKTKIDRQRLVEEDDDDVPPPSQPNGGIDGNQPFGDTQGQQQTKTSKENGKPLQISLESKQDMVSDVINSPGAAQPSSNDDDPFMGRWMAVIRLLAQVRYVSVLFVVWFMGFGIGLIFTFLFWHLQDLGGSPTLFGVASVINHISELLAYFLASSFIAQIGHINVLYAGLIGNVARFLYISWLTNPWWVLPFECVQGLTHAAVWATTCSYITQAIPVGLRSSAQGILQGLHHGLGRGCGAVFGGVLVYSYGSEVTFRAYGVTCIFVLAAFFGGNYFLKRQGVILDPKVPRESIEEDNQFHLDPHGVPSGIARDLSSSKLKSQADPVSSYGATLGTSARETLSEAFNTPASELPEKRKVEPPTEQVPKNPFTGQPLAPSGYSDSQESSQQTNKRERVEDQRDSHESQADRHDSQRKRHNHRKRDSIESQEREDYRGSREGYDQQETRRSRDAYDQSNETQRSRHVSGGYDQSRESHRHQESGYDQPRDQYGSRDSGYDQSRERHAARESSFDQPRERRGSRDSYDQSYDRGQGQHEGYDQGREGREGHHRSHRRSVDSGDGSYRGEHRGHRHHHRKRRSLDQFQDMDPNPREQVVFEKLPDLATRKHKQQQQAPRPEGEDLFRPY